MPDIGATLREARMRERIDITEVETATKIRAKYLRALENEEWDLLPGPTFVKTFLTTYGDYLGVDSKVLVEEYKQRFERSTAQELMPFGTSLGSRRQRRVAPVIPPVVVVGVVVAALLGILWVIGTQFEDDPEPPAPNRPVATATPEPDDDQPARERQRAPASRVDLQITTTALVNVCLVDARGRRVLDSVDLRPGAARRFRSRRFRVAFGNGAARMRVNGRRYGVPDRPDPIGFDIRPGRRPRELSAEQRPVCR